MRDWLFVLACSALFGAPAHAATVTCIPGPSCSANFGDYAAFSIASLLTVDAGPVHENYLFPDVIRGERNLNVPLTTLSRQYGAEKATSTAFGSVNNGTLRAGVEVSADSTISGAGGIAMMTVGWFDTLRLLGPTPTTTYRFRFSMHTQVNDIFASGPMASSDMLNQFLVFAVDPATGTLREPFALQYDRLESTTAPSVLGQCQFNGTVSSDCSFVYESQPGRELVLLNTLNPVCFGTANRQATACGVDVSGGAHFTIEALDTGATYETGSGLTYDDQPIVAPEPTTQLLTGLGVLGIYAARRKMRLRNSWH